MSFEAQAIKCPKCEDIVYSRHRHDLRWCSCNSCYIDGGFDYTRVGFITAIDPKDIKSITLQFDIPKEDLYNDYKSGANKHGIIKGKPESLDEALTLMGVYQHLIKKES